MCDGRAKWKQNHSLQIDTAAAVGGYHADAAKPDEGTINLKLKMCERKKKNDGDYVIWTNQKKVNLYKKRKKPKRLQCRQPPTSVCLSVC